MNASRFLAPLILLVATRAFAGPVDDQDFSSELPRTPPTEPSRAIKTLQTLPGFHVELVASEPNVASPVAIDFDEYGRLFVCEMRDYSEQDKERLGRIRMLEDLDGDGIYEKSTVFAEGLSWPTAVICYDGGVFVGAPPDVYYLKDTDGDGKAEVRKTVFTGFNRSNVQGLMNCFRWGLDNRIHGATSTAGADLRRPEDPPEKALRLSGRDFSFDPRTLDLRAESGGGQHGMCFDDFGRKFVSANSDHIQMVMIEDRYLAQNPILAASLGGARESIAADGPQAKVFRISPVEPWRVVRTRLRVSGQVPGPIEGGGQPAGYFTGATGVTIYRGDAFPPGYRGQAFVGDVGSNIVHRKILKPSGVGFVAERADEGKEFVASSDIWFRPCQFANAPDGALYIVDMYREVIEHPASLPPVIKKHLDLTSGRDRGRIWRVAPDGWKRRPDPKLSTATTEELVKLLEHRNGWHRDTASRLLYQRQDKSAGPMLEKLVRESAMPEAKIHAMHALASLSALTPEVLSAALSQHDMPVLEHAIRLSESLPAGPPELIKQISALTKIDDARVRYQAALTLGTNLDSPSVVALLKSSGDDRRLRAAAASCVKAGELSVVLPDLLRESGFVGRESGKAMLAELSRQAAARHNTVDMTALLRIAAAHPERADALLAGAASSGRPLRELLPADPDTTRMLDDIVSSALRTADDISAAPEARAAAIRLLLPIGTFQQSRAVLAKALAADQSQVVQQAALSALDKFDDPGVAALIVQAWPTLTPSLRSSASNVVFARTGRAAAFLDAVDAGTIKPADVDRARLRALANADDSALRDRVKRLLDASQPSASRQQVFDAYRPALSLKGDAAKGKLAFEKTCAACHRLGGAGNEIGPNLAAMQSRGAEAVLLNLIDPNREVNPQFVEYVVQTKSGRTTSGLLASETGGAVTLKRAGAETEIVPRADIKRMKSAGLSLMPEGLEKGLDQQSMADLIAYVLSAK